MLTRKKIRNGLSWAGIGIGVAGVVLYLLSWWVLMYHGPLREFEIGRGAIHLAWYAQERKELQPVPGALPVPGAELFDFDLYSLRSPRPVVRTNVGIVPATEVTRPRHVELRAAGAWRWLPRVWFPGGNDPATWRGTVAIPAWMLVLLGLWCAYRRLPWDDVPGVCPGCHFDLKGAPPLDGRPGSVRCPECGRVSRQLNSV